MSCRAFNCSTAVDVKLEPNPDISGLGVLISFLATAWATLLSLIVRYVTSPTEPSSNPLDASLRTSIQRTLKWNPNAHWDKPLRTIILAMSDQQLVTGFAILVSAYAQLQCGLSLYHWQMATTLAWFSSIAHLATLPFLQVFLQRHRYILYLRVTLMSGLAIMLAIALLPNGKITEQDSFSNPPSYASATPAKCVFDSPNMGFDASPDAGLYTILSEIILVGTLISRLLRMFPQTRNASTGILKFMQTKWQNSIIWLCEKLQGGPRWIKIIPALPLVFTLALLITTQALFDFLRSDAFEVLWLFFSLIWGTMRLFTVRYGLPKNGDVLEEDHWGFGQFVPVLLLFIPVLLVAESWSEIASKEPEAILHQSQTQLIPALPDNSPMQSQLSLHDYIPAVLAASSSIGSFVPANDSIYTRIITLCKHDFHLECWYLDSLYFILSCLIGASSFILPAALVTDLHRLGQVLVLIIGISLSGGCLAFTVIPLCGLIDSLEPRGSQRHTLSIIRIAIDQGKAYRKFRRIFYYCLPIFIIICVPVPMIVATIGVDLLSPGMYVALSVYGVFYVLPFFAAFLVAAYSIYSHV